jgi:hypothetical protein
VRRLERERKREPGAAGSRATALRGVGAKKRDGAAETKHFSKRQTGEWRAVWFMMRHVFTIVFAIRVASQRDHGHHHPDGERSQGERRG